MLLDIGKCFVSVFCFFLVNCQVGFFLANCGAEFFLVLHRALPDLQRMKHKPDQAFGHREVFCFCVLFLPSELASEASALREGRHSD